MIRIGHVMDVLRTMPDHSVHCAVTSPPYYGLRDYGLEPVIWEPARYAPMAGLPVMAFPVHADTEAFPICDHDWSAWAESHDVREEAIAGKTRTTDRAYGDASRRFNGNHQKHAHGQFCRKCGVWRGCLGLEPTPDLYIGHLVQVFRELRRVLRPDGTLWLNLGDSYASGNRPRDLSGIKPKDLFGIPWRAALALQADGWWLRSDMVWHKCLSGGAYVYAKTANSVGPILVKDMVRLKPDTVHLWDGEKWNRVVSFEDVLPDKDARKSRSNKELVEIVLRSGERIGCTKEHRWPTQRGLLETKDLIVGDVLESCRLPDSGTPIPPYLTEDVLWLSGLFLAEGSYSGDTMQISLNTDEKRWFERIQKAVAHYGGHARKYVYGNNLHIAINGMVIQSVIESIVVYNKSAGSHIHPDAWALPNSALRKIVEGYLNGDGSYDEKNDRHSLGFARNYDLERDLRTLAARLGAVLTLKPSFSQCQGKSFPSFSGKWKWSPATGVNTKSRSEIVEVRRSRARKFYDIALSEKPNVFALASGVLTHNSNPMPESVTDRPTRSHEMVFLLTPSERYFYDHVAVMEPAVQSGRARKDRIGGNKYGEGVKHSDGSVFRGGETRNRRDVWTISTRPYKEAHFAVMPPDLVEPCILAGTSEAGACPHCGAPWVRIIERAKSDRPASYRGSSFQRGKSAQAGKDDRDTHTSAPSSGKSAQAREGLSAVGTAPRSEYSVTTGWEPGCSCAERDPRRQDRVPCVVLDPFGGSGTTAMVARNLGRDWEIVEANPQYALLVEDRLRHCRAQSPCRVQGRSSDKSHVPQTLIPSQTQLEIFDGEHPAHR